jgi:hypothetical protein
MKKTTILLITILFVFMGSMAGAQEKQKADQKKPSLDEQIEFLTDSINSYNDILKSMDDIIGIYEKQKAAIIEERTKLAMYKEMLVSANRKQVKERGEGKEIIGYTAAGALGALTPAGGAALAVGIGINQALDASIKRVEQHNAQIERKLQEQREWKAAHPAKKK